MGMFDYVKYEAPCQSCGEPVTGFQSKAGDCTLSELTPEELFKIDSGAHFYSSCDSCGIWNEYTFEPPQAMKVIKVK